MNECYSCLFHIRTFVVLSSLSIHHNLEGTDLYRLVTSEGVGSTWGLPTIRRKTLLLAASALRLVLGLNFSSLRLWQKHWFLSYLGSLAQLYEHQSCEKLHGEARWNEGEFQHLVFTFPSFILIHLTWNFLLRRAKEESDPRLSFQLFAQRAGILSQEPIISSEKSWYHLCPSWYHLLSLCN